MGRNESVELYREDQHVALNTIRHTDPKSPTYHEIMLPPSEALALAKALTEMADIISAEPVDIVRFDEETLL